jgi:hypothetical protein
MALGTVPVSNDGPGTSHGQDMLYTNESNLHGPAISLTAEDIHGNGLRPFKVPALLELLEV